MVLSMAWPLRSAAPTWRRLGLPWLACALGMWAGLAVAQTSDADTDPKAWLQRMQLAARQSNYQGTLVTSSAGALSSVKVAHYCVGDQTYERVEALDGQQQRLLRINEAVHLLWPQQRVAVVERRMVTTALPSSSHTIEPRALEHYDMVREGLDRVAGREAQRFLLRPRDELRYAQRLWADRSTGLMLRADILGPQGQVLESSGFSDVDIGVRPQPEQVTQALKKLDGYRIDRPEQKPVQLEAEGWAQDKPVPGFKLVGCVRRPLEMGGVADAVLQAVFSDGLTHLSLFIEAAEPKRALLSQSLQIGATATLRQRRGDHWITVMGDAPLPALKALADSVQRKR